MYPAQPAVAQIERIFLDHAKAEMLKHRHCVGQRDDLPQSIDLEAQLAGLVVVPAVDADVAFLPSGKGRSEEHTSELQSLMRISYAVFCLKKKKQNKTYSQTTT